ncbi:hypothetical protein VYU27_010096 [Nannochloropsis oceanica]
MRRALSLVALGVTLALTAAETAPTLILTSIKAVDTTRANKDQWSVKGYLNDPDGNAILAFGDTGLTALLANGNEDTVSETDFDADDCRLLNNDKGVICKVTGARLSLKRTKRVPKDAMLEVQRNRNTTTASSYYRVSGVFRRQEFENTLSSPLIAAFGIEGADEISDINYKCTEKVGTRATKFLCTPGTAPPTAAPTATPTAAPTAAPSV